MSYQALYDFDGTLTSHDTTTILLVELAKLRPWRVAMMSWYLIRMRLSGESGTKQKYKNKAIGFLIKNLDDERMSRALHRFKVKVQLSYRQSVFTSVEQVIQEGGTVLVVTASPSFAVQRCVGRSVVVIGTEFEKEQGIYTGRLSGKNCYGQEKVCRINRWAASRRQALNVTSAWGDHPSDSYMLSLAAERYWVVREQFHEQIRSRDPDATLVLAD